MRAPVALLLLLIVISLCPLGDGMSMLSDDTHYPGSSCCQAAAALVQFHPEIRRMCWAWRCQSVNHHVPVGRHAGSGATTRVGPVISMQTGCRASASGLVHTLIHQRLGGHGLGELLAALE